MNLSEVLARMATRITRENFGAETVMPFVDDAVTAVLGDPSLRNVCGRFGVDEKTLKRFFVRAVCEWAQRGFATEGAITIATYFGYAEPLSKLLGFTFSMLQKNEAEKKYTTDQILEAAIVMIFKAGEKDTAEAQRAAQSHSLREEHRGATFDALTTAMEDGRSESGFIAQQGPLESKDDVKKAVIQAYRVDRNANPSEDLKTLYGQAYGMVAWLLPKWQIDRLEGLSANNVRPDDPDLAGKLKRGQELNDAIAAATQESLRLQQEFLSAAW